MPKENDRAREVKETGEIGSAPFVAGDESTKVLQPREEPFDLPAAPIAPERSAVLREVDAIRVMGRDQFDAAGGEGVVESIAVVRRIANEPRRIVGEKAGV